MRYFEEQKKKFLESEFDPDTMISLYHLAKGSDESISHWTKRDCGIDFLEYVKMLMKEEELTDERLRWIFIDIEFQMWRVRKGI